MKTHATLKELLEDFTIKLLNRQMNGDSRNYSEFTTAYVSSNNLALGKPEPLAKNKDSESKCSCAKPFIRIDTKPNSCGNCGKVV